MAKKMSDLTAATELGDNDSFVFNDVAAGNDKRVTAAGLKSALDLATNEYVDDKASLSPNIRNNVRAFGAVGDGVANDQAAITDAYNNTPSGGTLYIPAGTYMCDVTSGTSMLVIDKPITVFAEKGAELILSDTSIDGARGVFIRSNFVVIQGLTIDGNKGRSAEIMGAADGFDVDEEINFVTFRDCEARNWKAEGFDVDDSYHVTFNNCKALNNSGNGFHISGVNKPSDAVFLTDCYADGNGFDRAGEDERHGNYVLRVHHAHLSNCQSRKGSRAIWIETTGEGQSEEPSDFASVKVSNFTYYSDEAAESPIMIRRGKGSALFSNCSFVIDGDLESRFINCPVTDAEARFYFNNCNFQITGIGEYEFAWINDGRFYMNNCNVDAPLITGNGIQLRSFSYAHISGSTILLNSGISCIRVTQSSGCNVTGCKVEGSIFCNGGDLMALFVGNNLIGTSDNTFISDYFLRSNLGIADQDDL